MEKSVLNVLGLLTNVLHIRDILSQINQVTCLAGLSNAVELFPNDSQ